MNAYPVEWRNWSTEKLQAVMTHELTHVERSDFVVALLAEVNRCLYWFHPLSWWLRTRLSDLAEEACDDAAIGLTGDPTGYARHLLEVAAAISTSRGRVIQPGLSMARQSNVEGRIDTILDFTRPLSRRLTWKATLLIATLAVPVIAVASALRPDGADSVMGVESGDRETVAENIDDTLAQVETPVDGPATAPPGRTTDRDAATPDSFRLSGKVLDPGGKPFKGARIHIAHWNSRMGKFTKKPFAESDADGQFDATLSADKCEANSRVIAVADGFGFAHDLAAAFDASGELLDAAPDYLQATFRKSLEGHDDTLKLTADTHPISGQLRNAEGAPVAPTRIEILSISDGRNGLDAWEAAAAKEDAVYQTVSKHVADVISGPPAQLTATKIELNSDGTFRIHGIGPDRIVDLAILAPNVASHRAHDALCAPAMIW